jgi:hypothetical protein
MKQVTGDECDDIDRELSLLQKGRIKPLSVLLYNMVLLLAIEEHNVMLSIESSRMPLAFLQLCKCAEVHVGRDVDNLLGPCANC